MNARPPILTDRALVLGGLCTGVDGSCSVHFGRCPTDAEVRDRLLRKLALADRRKLAAELADDPAYLERP